MVVIEGKKVIRECRLFCFKNPLDFHLFVDSFNSHGFAFHCPILSEIYKF